MNVQKDFEASLPKSFTVKLLGRRPARGLWGIKNTRQPVDDLVREAKEQNLSLPIVKLQVSPEGILIKHFPFKAEETIHKKTTMEVPKSAIKKTKTIIEGFKSFQIYMSKKVPRVTTKKLCDSKSKDDHYVEEKKNVELYTDFSLLKKMKKDFALKYDQSFFGIDTISYGVQDLVFTRVFTVIVVSEDEDRSHIHCYAFICEDKQVARALTYSLAAAFQIYSRSLHRRQLTVQHTPVKIARPKILAVDLRTPEERKFQTVHCSEA